MLTILIASLALSAPVRPVAHWLMQEARYQDGQIVAATGPNLMVSGFPPSVTMEGCAGLALKDEGDALVFDWNARQKWAEMPKRDFTFSVRFSPETNKGVQGLAACAFQPREGFTGWHLLVRDGKPELKIGKLGVASSPTITASQALAQGKVHRIDVSYDGKEARLYVDGALAGSAPAPFGEMIYNGRAGICFGDWWEGPRSYHFEGSFFESALFNQTLTPAQVDEGLTGAPIAPMPGETGENKLVIAPFFQYPTPSSATVVWETSRTATTTVRYGESAKTARTVTGPANRIHQVELTDLKPETTYFVQVESAAGGKKVTSEWASFRSGSRAGTPVKFAVVGDTQDHPEVNHEVAKAMFAERPDFAMIVGDLVGMGWNKHEWVNDFFGSMRPMFDHVPLIPVLGNHDRNARIYYDLMAVPKPKYCYRYVNGDVEIFVIDTNRDVKPGSPQYRWLEGALKASKAKWKIAAHHHPPYSSDIDDFGDAYVEPTSEGERDVRPLCKLYDQYGVDVCFAGHIHSYERTYPLRDGKVGKGTVYVLVGGGGGDLETPKPVRSTFSHTVRHGHHFGMVWADAERLEFRAYDVGGRRFDSFELKK